MKLRLWGSDDSGLNPPPAGVSYPGVLRLASVSTGALQAIGGILVALAGYALLLPSIAVVILGGAWLLRGRPGSFASYREQAFGYAYVEGMVASHLAIASLIVLTMLVVRYVHHQHPRWLCSVQPGFRWRYALACALAAVVVLNTVYWVSRVGLGFDWRPAADLWAWLPVIVLFSPLQAAGEEFLFRGYLLQAAGMVGRSPWIAVAVSAVIFAGMHGTQNVPLFIDRLGFGLLAGALVLLTGGLEAAIAAHAVNNVFAFGYAALSGGVGQVRGLQTSTWATTGWNLTGYAAVVLACWAISRWMRVSTTTPGLASGAAIR